MNIIPFEGKTLPAYLKKFDVSALNADLTAHAGGGFPVLSTKGNKWAVVRDGERTVLPNPKDPESPATYVDVVIIKANKDKSKVFYLKGYDPESSEKQKPDCYSPDGIAPGADAAAPQAKKCATCPHNQWGSKIGDKGATKGKACSDNVRLAVAPAGQVNDPMLLRVPPASIRNLGEYGQLLAKRGVGYNMVVTKIAFDPDSLGKITFKPVGFLDDASYAEVQEVMDSDLVRDITGGSLTQVIESVAAADAQEIAKEAEAKEVVKQAVSKAKQVTDEEVETAVRAAEKPSKAKPAEDKPKAKASPVVSEDLDVDLDGISFDDE
ncbi:MAG: Xanthomonas phage Xp15 [Pseudomonadota bacterium]|jgi:hypothetical protein